MKRQLQKLLVKLLNPAFRRLGYVQQTNASDVKQDLLELFYANLKRIGFIPKHIVDIGANHGTWTRQAIKHFPDAYYTLIEPQYWLQESIQDLLTTNPRIRFHATGAGSQSGSFNFTVVDRDDSCNFLMSPEEAESKGFKQLTLPVTTLNILLQHSTLPIPDIIKIDAEGLDIEVLKGATDFLGQTEIILIEAAVVSPFMPNTIESVIAFMTDNNYKLFDITDLNRPFNPSLLWLVELAFVKKNGFIDRYQLKQ